MFKNVHHVHYLVKSRDEMVEYFEKNFGLKPADLIEKNSRREAIYDIGKTQIQITEPTDPNSKMGKRLAKDGPCVLHVAWEIEDLREVAKDLMAKGNKLKNDDIDGLTHGSHGYSTINISPASSHGMRLQLAEGERKL